MEVRPGYKLTEVGAIPEDWEVAPVASKGEVVTGKALAINGPGAPRPYLRTKNVFDGRVEVDDVLWMPMTDAQFEQFRVVYGDVLLNEGQSLELVGRCAIYRGEYSEPCAIQNALLRFRVKPGSSGVFASYLFRFCQQSGVFARVALQTTSIAHLGASRFQRLRLAWPKSEAEQVRIAAVLNDVDDLLEALEQLIAKKLDLKQAAMQQLLTGQTRLSGFTGEWEVKSLGNIAPLQRGFDLTSSNLRAGPYPVVYSNGILNYHAKAKVQGPGVVTGRSGTIGTVTFVDGSFWPHNTALWVTSFKANNPRFVFYLYTIINFERFSTGSGVPTLNRNDVHALEFAIPISESEQTAIAAVLSDMDAEILALEQRLTKTRHVKQGMMQELLTGRIRLISPEESRA